jgi:hypothetical protein
MFFFALPEHPMPSLHVKSSADVLISTFRLWRRAQILPLGPRTRSLCTAIDRWEKIAGVEFTLKRKTNSPYLVAAIDELIESLRAWRNEVLVGALPLTRRLVRSIDQWDRDYTLELAGKRLRRRCPAAA